MRTLLCILCVSFALTAWSASAHAINATDCGNQYPLQQQIDVAAQIYIARINVEGASAQYRNVRLVCRVRSTRVGVLERARAFALEIDLDVNAKDSHGAYTGFKGRSLNLSGEELTAGSSEAIVVTSRADAPPPPVITPEDCDGIVPPCRPNPPRDAVVVPGTLPRPPDDGPRGIDRASENADLLYSADRYVELDALIARYATLKDRVDDGRFKLSGIDLFLDQATHEQPDGAVITHVQDWRSVNAKSIGAALLEAQYWYNGAWRARGNGYVSDVSPEGRKLFHARLERAMAALTSSEDYALSNPLWFTKTLEIQLGLGASAADRFLIYKRGIIAFPEFFPMHFAYMTGLLPRWGGSKEAMAVFIENVVENSIPAMRAQTYTRLWWYADQISGGEVRVFDDGASWSRMREGFESLVKSQPGSIWIRMNYAAFACRAGDAATYLRLRPEVRRNMMWYGTAFPSNFTLEICDLRAANGTT